MVRALRPPLAFAAVAGALMLGGCDWVVMNPAGDIAVQQRDLVLIATVLMLAIVLPVMALTVLFAWRYRASNRDATYEPDWDHSTALELVIWSAPLLIIICLGAVTWTGTHLLDPYRPLDRVAPGRPVARGLVPLDVQVVSLDWKWLFIYPQYGIATVNELAAPVDRPIRFRLSSSSVMNTFYVPALAGMIYTMPSMETKLHAVINRPGNFAGISANYSGAGFSGMRFRFHGLNDADFARWVARNRASAVALTRPLYLRLEKPSENVKPMRFGRVDAGLFDAIVGQCVRPGTTCMQGMMAGDGGDTAGMKHKPGHGAPEPKRPEEPLTSAGAGKAPPQTPGAVQHRSNASPSNPNTL